MEYFWKDLRQAVRGLIHAPQFTVSAVLVLSVGIGITSVMFSMLNAYRFRSAPVRDGDSLIVLAAQRPTQQNLSNLSFPNFKDIRDRNSVFAALIGYAPVEARVRSGDFSGSVRGLAVTGNYFEALGVLPAVGRVLSVNDDTIEATPAVVISHYLWQTRFNADPSVTGREFYINVAPFIVAGVAEDGFRGTDPLFRLDFWAPLAKGERIGRGGMVDRNSTSLRVLGRLRRDVGLKQAQANLDVLTVALREQYPVENRDLKTFVLWEKRARPEIGIARQLSLLLVVVMAIQAIGLAVAAVNCTSLMLARAVARQRELALRLALGASRSRLFREILFESLCIGSAAGAIGIGLAYWGIGVLSQIQMPGTSAFYMDWQPDWRVFAFALLLTLSMAVGVAAAPTLAVMRTDLQRWLQGGYGASAGKRVSRLRYRVVVSQFTSLASALITAGVLQQSMGAYAKTDLGFQTDDRLLVRVSTADSGWNVQRNREFVETFLSRIKATPGVIAADFAEDVRLSFDSMFMEIAPAEPSGTLPMRVAFNVIGRDYFTTMGIPLVRGRAFAEYDREGAAAVAVVNETLAEKLWPGQNPLGKRFVSQIQGRAKTFEVIGVERTGKYYSINEPPRDFFYLPYSQEYRSTLAFHVHSNTDPEIMTATTRRILREIAPNLAIFDVTTQNALIDATQFGPPRLAGAIMGFVGGIQFLVAAIGMYGLLSYLAKLQTREIGIRMALGATSGRILNLYIGRGGKLAARGLVQGVVLSLIITSFMRSFIPGFQGISRFDAATAIGVGLLIAVVTILAGYFPTQRVLADNPVSALRHE